MPSPLLPSIPYPPAGDGYWSPVTATLNWCEEDYYATFYSAEIVNTLTNLYFVYLALKGIHNCRVHAHDTICQVAFFNMLFIGVGSMLFHTTLNYYMQLLDELSMIYLTSTTFYASFSFRRPPLTKLLIALVTLAFSAFVTLYYHHSKNPVFHQNAFAVLAAIVIFRGVWDSVVSTRKGGKEGGVDREMRKKMWWLAGAGVGAIGIGFAIWNLDNFFCARIRAWRRAVGLPWGVLLEGHGWWHIFTALGAYYNLVWMVWLRYCLGGTPEAVEMRWPSLLGSLPEVVRKSPRGKTE